VTLLRVCHLDAAPWPSRPLPQLWRAWVGDTPAGDGHALVLPRGPRHPRLSAMQRLLRLELGRLAVGGGLSERGSPLGTGLEPELSALSPLLRLLLRLLRTCQLHRATQLQALLPAVYTLASRLAPPLAHTLTEPGSGGGGGGGGGAHPAGGGGGGAPCCAVLLCAVLRHASLLQQHLRLNAVLRAFARHELTPRDPPGGALALDAAAGPSTALMASALVRGGGSGGGSRGGGGVGGDHGRSLSAAFADAARVLELRPPCDLAAVMLPLLQWGHAPLSEALLQLLGEAFEPRRAFLAQAPQLLLLHDAEAVALHAAASTALTALRRHLATGMWSAQRGEPSPARAETRELRALLERLRELLAPHMPGTAEDDEGGEGGEGGGGMVAEASPLVAREGAGGAGAAAAQAAGGRLRRLQMLRALRAHEPLLALLERAPTGEAASDAARPDAAGGPTVEGDGGRSSGGGAALADDEAADGERVVRAVCAILAEIAAGGGEGQRLLLPAVPLLVRHARTAEACAAVRATFAGCRANCEAAPPAAVRALLHLALARPAWPAPLRAVRAALSVGGVPVRRVQEIVISELHALSPDALTRLLPVWREPGGAAYARRSQLMQRRATQTLALSLTVAERREIACEIEALRLLADVAAGPCFGGEALARRLVPLAHAAAAIGDEASGDALRLPLLALVCTAYFDVEVAVDQLAAEPALRLLLAYLERRVRLAAQDLSFEVRPCHRHAIDMPSTCHRHTTHTPRCRQCHGHAAI